MLGTACLAVFAINLDTTIVNVALPSLSRQLHAGTSDLQWIVDAYNLSFAALVLAGGSIGDRFGRRPVLLLGLLGFASSSAAGAACSTSGQLTVARLLMGSFAALIYPTTLSIIANAYPDRQERIKAVGVWGAVTGLGVAVGPVTGGLLLAHFWWGSVFLAMVPVGVVAAVLTFLLVPESHDPDGPPLDLAGLVTSSAMISALVYTIIEAPNRGWTSGGTELGFAATVLLGVVFVAVERRREHPMLDLSLFRTPAFSGASAAVTIAFFALFGFIFLITQYLQFVRSYSPDSTGVRILPVAIAIAVGSVGGALLANRLGTRVIVVTGLLMFGASLAWIATSDTQVAYGVIAAQMALMGLALGMTTAPATESILSVLPAAKAGIGSAVNDATREAGGTLGVAVIGSVYNSVYQHHLGSLGGLSADEADSARSSIGSAFEIARQLPAEAAARLHEEATRAFMAGLHTGCTAAAVVCGVGALAALTLPGPQRQQAVQRPPANVARSSQDA